ncbi:hypothetical protein [Mesorhizobium sp.]|uniref:hypothetical protein n=1 Tax=Mesorhizobium sp. TaxID=1871066 RepID=UPI00257FD44A|nr:hypothetical protein [Mesorhizobium sp.]
MRKRAIGRSGPPAVKPVRGLARVGSEGLLAFVASQQKEAWPDIFMNHPGPDSLRAKSAPAGEVVIITDFIGSGNRIRSMLDKFWANAIGGMFGGGGEAQAAEAPADEPQVDDGGFDDGGHFGDIEYVSEGDYGVLSRIEDDELLNLVIPQPETFAYAEERRLFCVALTRASLGVYSHHQQSPAVPLYTGTLRACRG